MNLDQKQLSSGEAISPRTISRPWAASPIRAARKNSQRVILPQQWVHEAVQAALDAMFGVEDRNDPGGAVEAGKAAYRANMPPLTCPSMIRGYVACIGEGVRSDWLSQAEAQQCVRLAHAAMTAHGMGKRAAK